jgi:hypothetical protein
VPLCGPVAVLGTQFDTPRRSRGVEVDGQARLGLDPLPGGRGEVLVRSDRRRRQFQVAGVSDFHHQHLAVVVREADDSHVVEVGDDVEGLLVDDVDVVVDRHVWAVAQRFGVDERGVGRVFR